MIWFWIKSLSSFMNNFPPKIAVFNNADFFRYRKWPSEKHQCKISPWIFLLGIQSEKKKLRIGQCRNTTWNKHNALSVFMKLKLCWNKSNSNWPDLMRFFTYFPTNFTRFQPMISGYNTTFYHYGIIGQSGNN